MSDTQNEILTLLESVKQQVAYFDAVILNNPKRLRFDGNAQFIKLQQDSEQLSIKLKQHKFYMDLGQSGKYQQVLEDVEKKHLDYLLTNLSDTFSEQTEQLKTEFKQQNPIQLLNNYQSPNANLLYISKYIPQANTKAVLDLIQHVQLKYEYHVQLLFINEILNRIETVLSPPDDEEEEEEQEESETPQQQQQEEEYGKYDRLIEIVPMPSEILTGISNIDWIGTGRVISINCAPWAASFVVHVGKAVYWVLKQAVRLGLLTKKAFNSLWDAVQNLPASGSFMCKLSKEVNGLFLKNKEGFTSFILIATVCTAGVIGLTWMVGKSEWMSIRTAVVAEIAVIITAAIVNANKDERIKITSIQQIVGIGLTLMGAVGTAVYMQNTESEQETIKLLQEDIARLVDTTKQLTQELTELKSTPSPLPPTPPVYQGQVFNLTLENEPVITTVEDSKDIIPGAVTINTTIEAMLPLTQNTSTTQYINNTIQTQIDKIPHGFIAWNISSSSSSSKDDVEDDNDIPVTFVQNGSIITNISFHTPVINSTNNTDDNDALSPPPPPNMEWYQIMSDAVFGTTRVLNDAYEIMTDPVEYKTRTQGLPRTTSNVIAETIAPPLSIVATGIVAQTLGTAVSLVPTVWKNWNTVKVLTGLARLQGGGGLGALPQTIPQQQPLLMPPPPSYADSISFNIPTTTSTIQGKRMVGTKKNKKKPTTNNSNSVKQQLVSNIHALNRLFQYCLLNTPVSDQFDVLRYQAQAL